MRALNSFPTFLILAAVIGISQATAADGPYPVWWSPSLELQSLDKIDARLERPFWRDRTPIEFRKDAGSGTESRRAKAPECRSLLNLTARGYQNDAGYILERLTLRMGAECHVIDSLKRAVPAVKSYVRDFRLVPDALDYLPWMISKLADAKSVCLQAAAKERRLPWSRFAVPDHMEVEDPNEMTIFTGGRADRLTIFARADFNNDGLEDILLLNSSRVVGKYDDDSEVFLITRESPGGVFRVLEREKPPRGSSPCDGDEINDALAKLLAVDPRPRSHDGRPGGSALESRRNDRVQSTSTGPEGPYPIWWSRKLELESLNDIDTRLARQLWPGENGLKMYKFMGLGVKPNPVEVDNCKLLLALRAKGYDGLGGVHEVMLHQHARCKAIELLKQALPAANSYVRDFKLDRAALDYLPWMITPGPSCSGRCLGVAVNERRVSWSTITWPEHVDLVSPDEMVVYTPGWADRLTVVARADIDRDGTEDLVVLNDDWATEGRYSGSRLFVITRDRPNGVFRVLNAENYLCQTYRCDADSGNRFLREMLPAGPFD